MPPDRCSIEWGTLRLAAPQHEAQWVLSRRVMLSAQALWVPTPLWVQTPSTPVLQALVQAAVGQQPARAQATRVRASAGAAGVVGLFRAPSRWWAPSAPAD